MNDEAIKNDLSVDCISRQAAIDAMATWDWQDSYLPIHFQQLLEELPPVSPARPKGKWIKQTLSVKPFGEDTVLCDKCAFMTDKDNSYNFCPNCGADMRAESENKE